MRILCALAVWLCLGVAVAEAQTGPVVKQSTCTATWPAPQVSADGTNLADLKEYRVYVASTVAGLTPTLAPTAVVPAPAGDPAAGATGTWSCKSLAPGQWFLTVAAADTSGNEGVRSPISPFVSTDDVAPGAPGVPVMAGQ